MRYDSISGLDAADERWYSPTLQIWTSVDPIRFFSGVDNLYRFVADNPAVKTDPTGLEEASSEIQQQVIAAIQAGIDAELANMKANADKFTLLFLDNIKLAWHFVGTLTVTISDAGNPGSILPRNGGFKPLRSCRCGLIGSKVMTYPLDLKVGIISTQKLRDKLPSTRNLDERPPVEIVQLSSLAGQSSRRIPRVVKNCWVYVTKNLTGKLTVGLADIEKK